MISVRWPVLLDPELDVLEELYIELLKVASEVPGADGVGTGHALPDLPELLGDDGVGTAHAVPALPELPELLGEGGFGTSNSYGSGFGKSKSSLEFGQKNAYGLNTPTKVAKKGKDTIKSSELYDVGLLRKKKKKDIPCVELSICVWKDPMLKPSQLEALYTY